MDNVADGSIRILAGETFPVFLYTTGIQYDPDDLWEGFLRGPLLVQVSQSYIYSRRYY